MPGTATLTLRLDPGLKSRLDELAARAATSAEALAAEAVAAYLAGSGPPDPARVVAALRDRRAWLAEQGVESLWLVGSVARGGAAPGSDVDLLARLRASPALSLVGFARLRADLRDLLGHPVDLIDADAVPPAARDALLDGARRVL